jgi:hypothetical protein
VRLKTLRREPIDVEHEAASSSHRRRPADEVIE